MIPTCIAGIHEFWRNYRKPSPAKVAASQEVADASDTATGSDRQHGGSGRQAIAKADGACFESNAPRYRKLALAALKPLARPTGAMVDAAHAAVWFDAFWAINSRADFKKTVRAMIRAAIEH